MPVNTPSERGLYGKGLAGLRAIDARDAEELQSAMKDSTESGLLAAIDRQGSFLLMRPLVRAVIKSHAEHADRLVYDLYSAQKDGVFYRERLPSCDICGEISDLLDRLLEVETE